MKPIIGIISRGGISEEGHKIDITYEDIKLSVKKSGGIPISISNDDIYEYINICQGFILQGGDDIDYNDLDTIKLLYEKNIPLLGICLGMQEMAFVFDGIFTDVDNHKNNGLHEINIERNSMLNKILDCERTLVNSRHKTAILNTKLFISAKAFDNVIEAIEDKDKKFFLGLQWHLESMYDYDLNSRKIFDYFIKVCNDSNVIR